MPIFKIQKIFKSECDQFKQLWHSKIINKDNDHNVTNSLLKLSAGKKCIGETGASCYRGRLLQGHFMQNYYFDGEIADSSFILIHQGNH